jgi:hypothetical protein
MRRIDWSSLPLHPVLLAVFPVLFLFAENAVNQVTLDPLWRPLGVAIGGGLATLLLSGPLFRNWSKGGLFAWLLLGTFFAFGHAWNLLAPMLGSVLWLVAAATVILLVGTVTIWYGGRWVTPANRFLNVTMLVLVAFNGWRVVDFAAGGSRVAAVSGPSSVPGLSVGARRPDIFYVILDRYAGQETLRRLYGFDNRPFLRELEERGFSIAERSWSNYLKTDMSLTSSLNMDLLDREALDQDDPDTFGPIYAAFQSHLKVPGELRRLGYEYIHIASYWEPTGTNVDADRILRYESGSEFSAAVLATTAWMLINPVAPDDDPETIEFPELARDHTLYEFDRLEDAAGRPGPTFVFAHVLVPHPPYVFNADGSMPTTDEVASRGARKSYIEQLKWTNSRVLALLDTLLGVPADQQPIVILQADEGPFPTRFSTDESDFEWLKARPDEIQEKYAILNAHYLPGVDPADYGFTDTTSPVNAFRIVFNAYFDGHLPLLPDVSYLSPDYDHIYDFVPYDREHMRPAEALAPVESARPKPSPSASSMAGP